MAEQRYKHQEHIFHTENLTVKLTINVDGDCFLKMTPAEENAVEKQNLRSLLLFSSRLNDILDEVNTKENSYKLGHFTLHSPLSDEDHAIVMHFLKDFDGINLIEIRGAALKANQLKDFCLLSRGKNAERLEISGGFDRSKNVILPSFEKSGFQKSSGFYSLAKGMSLKLEFNNELITTDDLEYLIECCAKNEVEVLNIRATPYSLGIEDLLKLSEQIPKGMTVVLNNQLISDIASHIPQHPLLEKLSMATTPAESAATAWTAEKAKHGIH